MSRITRAQKIAQQVLKKNRDQRLGEMLPNRYQNVARQVLSNPRTSGLIPRGGGLTDAARAVARSDAVGMGAGAILAGGGTLMLSQTDPNDLGRTLAQMDQPFFELMQKVQESASDLAETPQIYFMQVKQAYDEERQRQQELQNIEDFGTFTEPELEYGAIEPVSLLFAEGGSATLSNRDKGIALALGAAGMGNEPRFAERPPFSQVFTIENDIKNKYREYEIAVRNNELLRARNLVNEIDQLEQQKLMIQNQAASPLSNRDMEIANILESISQ